MMMMVMRWKMKMMTIIMIRCKGQEGGVFASDDMADDDGGDEVEDEDDDNDDDTYHNPIIEKPQTFAKYNH